MGQLISNIIETQFMTPGQRRKFYTWLTFSVLLPLTVYVVVFLDCLVNNNLEGVLRALARGDLIFLGVILFAIELGWLAEDLLLTPRTQADESSAYFWLVGTLIVLVLYTTIFGWVLKQSMIEPNAPPSVVTAWFSLGAAVFAIVSTSVQYRRLLLLGRI